MKKNKTFWLGVFSGVLILAVVEGAVFGGVTLYGNYSEAKLNDEINAVGEEDEGMEDSSAVFAESGNIIISNTEESVKVEVVPPNGYKTIEDYENAYGVGFINEEGTVELSYSIDSSTQEEMASYYEFEKQLMATSEYKDVVVTEIETMKVNGYDVNYLSLSYTFNDSEQYIEYCAYVMINEDTEFMCNIYGKQQDVNIDIIKECFNSQIPVNQ